MGLREGEKRMNVSIRKWVRECGVRVERGELEKLGVRARGKWRR